MQASLCTVDINSGVVEFPDELPCLPNVDRLLVQVSEKLQQLNMMSTVLTWLIFPTPRTASTSPIRDPASLRPSGDSEYIMQHGTVYMYEYIYMYMYM